MEVSSNTPAVVTGGASGLGEATARALAAKGAKVAIFDMNEEKGEAVAKDIAETHPLGFAEAVDEKAAGAAVEAKAPQTDGPDV